MSTDAVVQGGSRSTEAGHAVLRGSRSSRMPRVMRGLVGLLLLGCVFRVVLGYSLHANDSPMGWHPDEYGKVAQAVLRQPLNFNHPLLMLETTIQYLAWRGDAGSLTDQQVAEVGRSVSAFMVAVAAVALAAAGWRWAGLRGLVVVGALAGLSPQLVLYGHFFKEDASLLAGVALVVLAGTVAGMSARWYWQAGCYLLLGAACAVAASGKTVGVLSLCVPVLMVLVGPLPVVRSRAAKVLMWVARPVVVVVGFGAVFVAVNHRAFDFSGGGVPVVRPEAREGIRDEVEHALTQHSGVRLAVPNRFALRTVGEQTPGWVRLLAVLSVPGTLVLLVRRVRFWGRTERGESSLSVGPPLIGMTLFAVLTVALSRNVIPFARYAAPLVVLTGVLAGVGLLFLFRLVQGWLGRTVTGVLFVLSALAVVTVQVAACRAMATRIEQDSRYRLADFIATLPPGTSIVADWYAGLGTPTGRLREVATNYRVWNRGYAVDSYRARAGPFDYIVICDCAYDRYLDPEAEGVPEAGQIFERRKQAYEQLLSLPAVWEYRPARPTRAFADPQIRVIQIR